MLLFYTECSRAAVFDKFPLDGDLKSEEACCTVTEWRNILEQTGWEQFRKNKEVKVMETEREREW